GVGNCADESAGCSGVCAATETGSASKAMAAMVERLKGKESITVRLGSRIYGRIVCDQSRMRNRYPGSDMTSRRIKSRDNAAFGDQSQEDGRQIDRQGTPGTARSASKGFVLWRYRGRAPQGSRNRGHMAS